MRIPQPTAAMMEESRTRSLRVIGSRGDSTAWAAVAPLPLPTTNRVRQVVWAMMAPNPSTMRFTVQTAVPLRSRVPTRTSGSLWRQMDQSMSILFFRRRLGWVGILASFGWASPVEAQSDLTASAIGQITDAVFSAVLPQDSSASRVSVAKRKIRFDFDRTLSLFERARVLRGAPTELHLKTPATAGSRALLKDCSQAVPQPCAGLGWSIYSWLEPLSITDSEVVVRAHFSWPDRGSERFLEGSVPSGRAYLVGFSTEVYLTPEPGGGWRVSRRGTTNVGD
jgi:hypothetical protein